jgi:hypothetical protein
MINHQELRIKVCFLVESTYKMEQWGDDIWLMAKRTLESFRETHPFADIEAASVEYKDFGDPDQLSCTFFSGAESFLTTFSDVRMNMQTAQFSPDETTDVAGGVRMVMDSLDWSGADIKLLYHIGVSPSHGRRFHNGLADRFLNGDPRGFNVLEDMRTLALMGIHYMFLRISPDTDTMLHVFRQVYVGPRFEVSEFEDEFSQSSDEPDSAGE